MTWDLEKHSRRLSQLPVHMKKKALSLIVCPTSLLYNWKEEFAQIQSQTQSSCRRRNSFSSQKTDRKHEKLRCDHHFLYTCCKKISNIIRQMTFGYVILDEAQHIKNRGTRNAKSVKMILADHRLDPLWYPDRELAWMSCGAYSTSSCRDS